jgi:large subunit ribosomal protein L21
MYAVIEAGGKQYKVAKNDVILVERMASKPKHDVKINKVLLAKEGSSIHVGSPYLKSSHVTCEVMEHIRAPKVVAYKYKRRKSEKKKIGHRQEMTKLKVKEIEIGKG